MSGGELNVGTSEYVGLRGTGTMTQSGGTHIVAETLCVGHDVGLSGRLDLGVGSLSAATLFAGRLGYGGLGIRDASAEVQISEKLTLGAGSNFWAAPGSEVQMSGAAFENESTVSRDLGGLGNLKMIFEGGAHSVDPYEAAGEDMGAAIQ